jgi:hypothetical protein
MFLLIIGGWSGSSNSHYPTDTVELISINSKSNPVPEQFKNLKKFPIKIRKGCAGILSPGNCCLNVAKT